MKKEKEIEMGITCYHWYRSSFMALFIYCILAAFIVDSISFAIMSIAFCGLAWMCFIAENSLRIKRLEWRMKR